MTLNWQPLNSSVNAGSVSVRLQPDPRRPTKGAPFYLASDDESMRRPAFAGFMAKQLDAFNGYARGGACREGASAYYQVTNTFYTNLVFTNIFGTNLITTKGSSFTNIFSPTLWSSTIAADG